MYSLPLHVPKELLIDWCHYLFTDTPVSVQRCESRLSICRYYPLAIAPFHLWGLLGDHDQRVCESFYHALYACTIPTVRPFAFLHDISSRLGFKYR